MDNEAFLRLMLESADGLDAETLGDVLEKIQNHDYAGFVVLKRAVESLLNRNQRRFAAAIAVHLGLSSNANNRDIRLAIDELKRTAKGEFGAAMKTMLGQADELTDAGWLEIRALNQVTQGFLTTNRSRTLADLGAIYQYAIVTVEGVFDRHLAGWRDIQVPRSSSGFWASWFKLNARQHRTITEIAADLTVLLMERRLAIAAIDFDAEIRQLAIDWRQVER